MSRYHLIIFSSILLLWWLSCQKSNDQEIILSTWKKSKGIPGNLVIIYPQKGTLFPPEIAAPTIIWRDQSSNVKNWFISVTVNGENELLSAFTEQNQWKPDLIQWEKIKRQGLEHDVHITVLGYKGRRIVSGANTIIRTSGDSVKAAIFYRAVPLPFKYALEHLEQIRWHLGDISSTQPSPALLQNLPLCGNCHSFTPDGKTLAMDIDYANDKGSYVISPIARETILTADKIITWSDYRREDGEMTFGLLSQISPDGRYVASTVKDRSIFVAKDGLDYSQLFFPIKGIIAIYDRQTKKFFSLPGADDPAYVQSNPTWSPDGKYIYFAKAPVYHSPEAEKSRDIVLPTAVAAEFIEGKRDFKYDIYRIPFNQGKGGKPEPIAGASNNGMSNFFPRISPDGKWLVFTQAKNFMLLQPDSKLYIIPAEGGTPRELTCNTPAMNSWHSWSPNGKWLAFASKLRGPYADILLTHIDEHGQDSPPVVLEYLSFANRSVNIPEFVNVNPANWTKIVDQFSNQSHFYFTIGKNKIGEKKFQEAIVAFNKALQMDSTYAEVYLFKGLAEYLSGQYRQAVVSYGKAIALNPNNAEALINLGTVKYKLEDYSGALECYNKAIELDKKNSYSYYTRGSCKAKLGNVPDAIKDFTKAIELGYKSDKVYYERGLSWALLKNYQEALGDFQTALKINPNHFDALKKKGDCYYRLEKYQEAIETYTQALELNPNDKELYSHRGLCRATLKDFYGAIADYDQAILLDPYSAVDYCQRGLLKIKLGQKGAGCKDLFKAEELGFTKARDEIQKHCTK